MSNRSLKLSREGIKRAKTAIQHKGWTQEELAGFLGRSTQPISKFFNGKTVERNIFRDICDELNLNIQEVVDNSEDAKTEPDNKTSKNNIDINALVQEVRLRVQDNTVRQCGTIRVLDMSQPMVLNDIYTNVNILDKIIGRRGKEITELLQECRSDDFERFGINRTTEKRVPGLKAVETYSNLIVLGKPGAGKTTFLKYVAIQCIACECKSDTVPIFITLKDFAESGDKQALIEYITKRFQVCGVTYPQVTELLEHGRLLVLLDGLDEVKEKDTRRIIKEIRSSSENYYNNEFVITCRIAAKEYTFENFTEVEVADFDNEQIETFATKWFQSTELDLAKRFIAQLEEQKPIKELATNPL